MKTSSLVTKVCTKCGVGKSVAEFNKRKRSSDGFNHSCKECTRKYDAKYRSNHGDSISEKKKEWRDSNKQRIAATTRKWRKSNKDKYLPHVIRWKEIRKGYLGFIPINEKTDGLCAHHLDMNVVMFIPKELHVSIPHKQNDSESMLKINTEAWRWFYKQRGE